ncbi:MAG: PLP-dependent aminotransferase family protein [Cyanobacteria bacterium SZAS TMP-1]|nr:PLP-dependent aminotransferase family protein [Cyanobacteria bacterium SZAS TMP-1]
MAIAINLEYKPYVALYRRLSDALRKAILEGRLKLGEPLPSVRELAESLKLSRATVLKAYKDLNSQGLVTSYSGSGTFVAETLPGDLGELLPEFIGRPASGRAFFDEAPLSARGHVIVAAGKKLGEEHVHVPALEYGGTPIELSPMREWKTLMLKHCDLSREEQVAEMIEPTGIAPLRQAIASYVQRRRSISCTPENVVIFGAKQLRLELIGRLLLNAGDWVAYEDPGYPENRHTLESLGAVIVPIEVDEEGMSVAALRRLQQPPKLIYVSPSHQDPLGYVMSMERRRELLEYAAATGAFIVEDDFDNEFRYGKPVLPSLKALDQHDCVIYMASFWKVLYQSLRLSYVVFPRCLETIATLGKGYLERHLPLLDQLALIDFINDGHLEKHIKRTQRVLAVRRQCLILAITRYLRNLVKPLTEGGGTHVLLTFKPGFSEATIEQIAGQNRLNLMSTRPYYLGEATGAQYIVPFATVNIETIDDVVRLFSENLLASPRALAETAEAGLQDFAPDADVNVIRPTEQPFTPALLGTHTGGVHAG